MRGNKKQQLEDDRKAAESEARKLSRAVHHPSCNQMGCLSCSGLNSNMYDGELTEHIEKVHLRFSFLLLYHVNSWPVNMLSCVHMLVHEQLGDLV